MQQYSEITHRDGVPFVPYAVWKDIIFSGAIVLAICVCAVMLGPFGPTGTPDPTIIETTPRPDFFFLWLYALLSLLPPSAETPILLIGPAVGIAALLALPFLAGEGEKSWKRRPVAVLTVLVVAVVLGTLTRLGGAYARTVLSLPVHDCTGGFRCSRRTALEAIDWDKVCSRGYGFQLELNRAWTLAGVRFGEVPITFRDRELGRSKMTTHILVEAMLIVLRLRLRLIPTALRAAYGGAR